MPDEGLELEEEGKDKDSVNKVGVKVTAPSLAEFEADKAASPSVELHAGFQQAYDVFLKLHGC